MSVPGLVGSFRNDRDKLRRSPGVRKLMAYVAPCRRRDDPPQAATRYRPESGLARSRYATATVLVVHPCCAPAHSVAYRKVIVIIHDDLGRVGCTENRYCRMVRGLTGPRTRSAAGCQLAGWPGRAMARNPSPGPWGDTRGLHSLPRTRSAERVHCGLSPLAAANHSIALSSPHAAILIQ